MSSPRMLTPGLFGEFSRGSTGPMSKKPSKRDFPTAHRRHASRVLERAFEIGDCDEICSAVGAAAKLYSVVDIER